MIAVWLERPSATGKVKTLGYHPAAEEVGDIDQRPHIVVSEAPEMKQGFDMYYDFDVCKFEYIEKEKSEDQVLKEVVTALESENAILKQRQSITEGAVNELADIVLGGDQ